MNTLETLKTSNIESLKNYLKTDKNGVIEFYWDYDSQLSKDQINLIIEGKINDVENEIFENNLDYICDLETDCIKNAAIKLGIDIEDSELQDYKDELLDYISVDMRIKDLIKNTGPVNMRIELLSNYDCINSHWYESQSGYTYKESYFGNLIDRLNMNPKKVKELLNTKGVKTYGHWPNKKNRDGNELVDYSAFWVELENTSCGACLYTIVGTLDIESFMNGEKITKIKVPSGNPSGFYSSMNGGGSCIEAPLKRDLIIDLTKTFRTKYDKFYLTPDTQDGYSIDNAYGVTQSFWGKKIQAIN